MPFDGKQAAPLASRMREILGRNGEHWSRDYARDGRDNYCVLGAALAATGVMVPAGTFWLGGYARQFRALSPLLERAIARSACGAFSWCDLARWNDASGRRWEDISAFLDALEQEEVANAV